MTMAANGKQIPKHVKCPCSPVDIDTADPERPMEFCFRGRAFMDAPSRGFGDPASAEFPPTTALFGEDTLA